MKLFRTLLSFVFSLALVVGLLPSASVFADSKVPSWGDPSIMYGTPFMSAEGDFTQSGLAFGESRPVQLDRWQAVFTDSATQQITNTMDKYDVFDLQNQQPGEHLDTKNGYGLIPFDAKDKLRQFVQMSNGNADKILSLLDDAKALYDMLKELGLDTDPVTGVLLYQITDQQKNIRQYVRSSALVYYSGGRVDRTENTPTNPFDPGQPNGTAYFLTSPWPKITTASVQGDTIHVAFTTYGLNAMHHPTAKITNGTDEITQDFGKVNKDGSHDVYNGTWDIPVSEVTSKLGPLDKLSVVIDDGYWRTAQAPLSQNLAIAYNWAADYTVPYTAGQPASFTQALVLTRTSGTAPDPADKYLNDTLKWEYSVDGGPWQPLTVLPDTAKVFDASGKLKDKIVIRTDTLNTIPGRLWGSGTHKIQIQVSATPGDAGKYLFSSQDSGANQPSAIVTVTFVATHKLGEQPPNLGQYGPLTMKWSESFPDPTSITGRKPGGLPTQVNPGGYFIAPIEVSNDGDVPITTTLDFEVDGNVVIERDYSCDCDNCKAPPPDFMNFPLKGTIQKTLTVPGHGVVFWDVQNDLSYLAVGYQGPPEGGAGCITYVDHVVGGFIPLPNGDGNGQSPPVTAPLTVGWPAATSNTPEFQPNYAAYLKVTAEDPQDYITPSIDAWVGVKGLSIPPKSKVRLVQ